MNCHRCGHPRLLHEHHDPHRTNCALCLGPGEWCICGSWEHPIAGRVWDVLGRLVGARRDR